MPIQILVVDDDSLLAQTVQSLCFEKSFHVSTASSPVEAIDKLRLHSFDLILLNRLFPHSSGFEVLRYIKETETRCKVLMISKVYDCETRISALKEGVDDFLPKPFHPQELLLKIEKLIHRQHSTSQQLLKTHHFTLNIYSGEVIGTNWSVHLRRKEFEILTLLIQHRNIVLTKEYIQMRLELIQILLRVHTFLDLIG